MVGCKGQYGMNVEVWMLGKRSSDVLSPTLYKHIPSSLSHHPTPSASLSPQAYNEIVLPVVSLRTHTKPNITNTYNTWPRQPRPGRRH